MPQGWAETTLGDIVTLRGNKVDPAKIPEQSFIGLEDIEPHTSAISRVGQASEVKSSVACFEAGDVLYSRLRPYLNKVTRPNFSGVASAEILVLQASDAADAEFVRRKIMTREFLDFTAMLDKGDRPRVSYDEIADFVIPLPPLLEQRRIVAKIDSLTGKSKRAHDHLDHIPRLVEKYKQAVLAAAFRGDLTREWRAQNLISVTASDFVAGRQFHASEIVRSTGKGRDEKTAQFSPDADMSNEIAAVSAERILPEGWCWTSIGCVFGVYIGATPSRKEPNFWDGDIPWVSSGEVAFCRIAETRETISAKGLACTSTRLHPPGTVLIGMIGEGKTRGQAAILDLPACNNQNCAAIRVSEAEYSAEYVYWYLWSVYENTRNVGAGNNQPALNKDRVQRLILPLAPAAEAIEIAKLVDTAFARIDRLASQANSAHRLIEHLNQEVPAKAFRGELVPQDPADEPASILLERIGAERAAAPKQKRGRRKAA